MTQNKNKILDYLNYLNQTFGVTALQMPVVSAEVLHKQEAENVKKIFWKSGHELWQQDFVKDTALTKKFIFINQNQFDPQLVSLFHKDNWELFKKMVSALGIDFQQIEVWETNENGMQELFHFLLDFDQAEGFILMLNSPVQEKNIYPYNKGRVLETYSPLLFNENPDLKRNVWTHFKDFKALS